LDNGGGNNTISGGEDSDTIIGGDGRNLLMGDNGSDFVGAAGDGSNTVMGGDGNDWLSSGNGEDLLMGGNGNDTIFGGGNHDSLLGGTGTDTLFGDNGKDTLDGGNGIDQLFGGEGNDLLLFGGQSETYDAGSDIDALSVTQADVRFVNFDQNTNGVEIVDMRSGAANSVTLNAADVLDFNATTDLVVRGDTGATADTVHLQQTGGVHFALDTSGVALNNPAYGGPGTLYDVYSNGTEHVAVEQGVTVDT
jgi:Ca2+-binding RTX toxin-like protein